MKIKNLKVNLPGFLAFVLAISLVSCHNDSVRREAERKEAAKKYFEDLPKISVEEVIEDYEASQDIDFLEEEAQKTR